MNTKETKQHLQRAIQAAKSTPRIRYWRSNQKHVKIANQLVELAFQLRKEDQ